MAGTHGIKQRTKPLLLLSAYRHSNSQTLTHGLDWNQWIRDMYPTVLLESISHLEKVGFVIVTGRGWRIGRIFLSPVTTMGLWSVETFLVCTVQGSNKQVSNSLELFGDQSKRLATVQGNLHRGIFFYQSWSPGPFSIPPVAVSSSYTSWILGIPGLVSFHFQVWFKLL